MNSTRRTSLSAARTAAYLCAALSLVIGYVSAQESYAATVVVFGAGQAAARRDAASHEQALGISVEVLQPEQLSALGLPFGLKVDNVDVASGEDTLLDPGDVIVQINHIRVSSLAQFERILREQKAGEWISLLVERDGVPMYVDAKVRG
jgi:S1-C subfamily serine protease